MRYYKLIASLFLVVCLGQVQAGFSIITLFGTGDPATSSHITVTARNQDKAYLIPDFFYIEDGASLTIWGMEAIGNAGISGPGQVIVPTSVPDAPLRKSIASPGMRGIPNPIAARDLIKILPQTPFNFRLFQVSGAPVPVKAGQAINPGIYLLKLNSKGLPVIRKILVTANNH
jgi:hypothetical protein